MPNLGDQTDPLIAHARALFENAVETSEGLSDLQRSIIKLGVLACSGADTRLALREVRAQGVDGDLLEDLAAAAYLSRGKRAGEAISLVERVATDSRRSVETVPVDDILLEFAEVFGEVPEQVRLLATHAPAALQAYHLLRSHTIGSHSRHALTIELTLFAVNAADLNTEFATIHALGRGGVARPKGNLLAPDCVLSRSAVLLRGVLPHKRSWRAEKTRSNQPQRRTEYGEGQWIRLASGRASSLP
jgi:hypothetical protein